MEKLSRRQQRELQNAAKNRRELIAARLTRRDLVKLGLLTSAGYLIRKRGLSARATSAAAEELHSPPTRAFIEPLPIMPIKEPVASLDPAPTEPPNTAAGEGRTRDHQALSLFPPQKLYKVVQQKAQVSMSPDLPLQTIWGFDGITPGPTYIAKYGEPILVRNVNNLPADNGGFGQNQVTTHLHNGHTPSESDGFPLDFFPNTQFPNSFFYDQHYPNVLAGFTDPQSREAMGTLWYHDHRVEFTSQNVYKGLAGFYLLFSGTNQFDTGNENTGFRLPTFPDFDVPMMFADKVFDPEGKLFFDLFNLDGILGDKFLVNGKIQPLFHVHPRRYRFRWLNTGPSRFHEIYITDLDNLSAHNWFWQISNDGNLLPQPVQVESVRLSVAERADVIIDFSQFAGKTIYLENRLEQVDGRGPRENILAAGQGNLLLQIIVDLPTVADHSVDPGTMPQFFFLPDPPAQTKVTRFFKFDRSNGMWAINGRLMDDRVRFRIQQNTAERWILENSSGGWQHPIHNHFEEFQILSINGQAPPTSPLVQTGRKDVVRLEFGTTVELFSRFRDFLGRYVLHCHNVIHEDHAMMLIWEIDKTGDTNPEP